MPYAIHLRKSRADLEAEARGEGESLARHRKRLRELADRMQLDVVAEYCEIKSGDKLSDRPEMQRLLSDVSRGLYDGVLDVEIARITRGDLMDQGRILNTFKFSGTKIITPEHTYDLSEDWDEDIITNEMMGARREYKYTKRRLQRGRLASAQEGLWQSPAPYGYRKVKITRGKGWTLEIDEEQASFVRMIFDMYAVDKSGGAKIADRLNALGSRTNRGNLWTADSVRVLASNPVYAGMVRWNDRTSVTRMVDGQLSVRREKCDTPILVQGKHPPIIDQALWEAAQRTRRSNDLTRCHTSAPLRNPLVGLVYCAVCGKSMVRKDNGNSRGSRYDMLRCTTKGCPTVATSISIVEESILSTVEEWALSPESDEDITRKDDARSEVLAAARESLSRLRAQRQRIFDAYEEGTYDTATFVARRTAKDAEIADAEAHIAELEKHPPITSEEAIRMQLPQIRRVLDLYDTSLTPPERNKLLKSVIARVEYKKTERSYRNQSGAAHLSITVFPCIPE